MASFDRDQIYINSAWVAPAGKGRLPVTNPATGEPLGSVPEGAVADAEAAVAAARAAFDGWSRTPLAGRLALLTRIQEGLKARAEEIGAPSRRKSACR